MVGVRYVGVPRAIINTEIGAMSGWREFGERILARCKEECPVGEEGEDFEGPHLVETLEMRLITGEDPRIMIGSKKQVGKYEQVNQLDLIVSGTEPHGIDPRDATILRWTSGGTTVFANHVDHPGTSPNNFVLDSIRMMTQGESGGIVGP